MVHLILLPLLPCAVLGVMVSSIYSYSLLHAVAYFCASTTTAFVNLSSVHDVVGVLIELPEL